MSTAPRGAIAHRQRLWDRAPFCFQAFSKGAQKEPQGLKPALSLTLTARLKACPSTDQAKRKRPHSFLNVAFINAGNDLLSHTLSRAVQSARRGLTSVFGMGTGGSPAV